MTMDGGGVMAVGGCMMVVEGGAGKGGMAVLISGKEDKYMAV